MSHESLIVKPEEVTEIKHHDVEKMKDIGNVFKYLDGSMVEGADLRIMVRKIESHTENKEDYVKPHTHEVDQFYLLVGEPGQLAFEITLGDEKVRVESPCTVHIPKGLPHCEKYLKGNGHLITVLTKGTYP